MEDQLNKKKIKREYERSRYHSMSKERDKD